jgi:anti-sigma factor RsiW
MRGDEETLTDYLDGRLAPAEKAAFEARLAAEPALERRLRLLRAVRSSLKAGARAMPPDLKAALKREARSRAAKPRPSWRGALRSMFGGSGLGCGLGAAFAAALLSLAVRLTLPRRPSGSPARSAAPVWTDAAASAGLKSLWTEDDGRDRDDEG